MGDLELAVLDDARRPLSARVRVWHGVHKPALIRLVGWARTVPGYVPPPRPAGALLIAGMEAEARWRRRQTFLATWMESLSADRLRTEVLLRSSAAYDVGYEHLAELLRV